MKHIRKYVWVDPILAQLLTEKGVDLSAFVNKALAGFLDLPEDPTEKLLREGVEKVVSYTRLSYINEIRGRLRDGEQTHLDEDLEKAKQKELIKDLERIGVLLQKTSCYPQIIEALSRGDPESSYWDTALCEINNLNGRQYELHELWNQALDWYYKCARGKI